jgi:hypothetical protein
MLTRETAIQARISDPDLMIDPGFSLVFSPPVDFGFGTGYKGLPSFGGSGIVATSNSYFFWIDDNPMAYIEHKTRFVLLDASVHNPTLANGGIIVSNQG